MPQPRKTVRRSARLLLVAATAAVGILGLAASAGAQQRVPQEGDALDASNRVGSGGSNVGGVENQVNDRYRLGNDLVTGNVTGGRGFRDIVPYGSDREFRDFTGGMPSSRFAGYSSGVAGAGVINNAQYVRPYYGPAEAVNPPSDFARIPGTGGYVPQAALRLDERLDLRSNRFFTGRATAVESRLVEDADAEASLLTMPESILRYAGSERGRAISPFTRLARDARLEPLTPERLRELRSEFLRNAEGQRLSEEELQALSADPARTGGSIGDQLVRGAPRGAEPLVPLAGSLRQQIDAALRQHSELYLADPAEQSTLYAELLQRLERFREQPLPDEFQPLGGQQPVQPPAEPAEDQPGQPPVQTPPAQPLLPGLSGLLPTPVRPPPDQTGPQSIGSLAEGASSPTLRRMLEQSEALMAEGRYVSAIARFDAAERIVPNQPLTRLGRALAELGAGYYRPASLSLRSAFDRNPALMMARLDLSRFIDDDRLAEIRDTLVNRLETTTDADSAFLLAFIAFHSGERQTAGEYLNTAEQRSLDSFYGEVARHWGLAQNGPATRPAAD